MKVLIDGWRSLGRDWRLRVEGPMASDAIAEEMHRASIPAFSFYFMLAIATVIATLGLVEDSPTVVIGAMIIAPLMSPIMSLAYGVVSVEWRMVGRSLLPVATGVVLVLALAFLSMAFIGLRAAGLEILSHTSPTLLDLGVAMAAGAAGAFVNTRKSILNSIAGVAIAVALVPPLAVTGIGLALTWEASTVPELSWTMGRLLPREIVAGAFLLFLTNLVGIVVVAGIVFICHGYGHWKRALLGLALVAGLSFFIVQPLSDAFYRLYVKNTVLRVSASLTVLHPELISGDSKLESMHVRYDGDAVVP